ncbi:MAG: LuxR family transcriptional regulator [Sphingopyxis sp.]|uniref:helix-turn-helix transcriptional regulator n=1 Tax=Sphingopyxis sp. TaxID=1908224 RepID=UPI001A63C452|nr:LuxR family transcriptional regulator [Sphingopyxis sp.]MBL9071858.1 LuxR family transcriptional regulator [Sphingopyxis sp.]
MIDRLIDQHRRAARAARSGGELLGHTVGAVGELGFERVALVQMIWFQQRGPQHFCLDNYGEWRDVFLARGYYRRDPAHLASLRTNRCFAWSELSAILGAGHVHQPILREAARHGLSCGMTVPVGVPGEPAGCGSIGTGASELPPREHCRAAAWIIDEAFAEARRLHGLPVPRDDVAPPLSHRRHECLRLAAMGMSDADIAASMGIALATVRTHMAYLRRVYGVRSRTQLARLAHRLGLLGIDDIFTQ